MQWPFLKPKILQRFCFLFAFQELLQELFLLKVQLKGVLEIPCGQVVLCIKIRRSQRTPGMHKSRTGSRKLQDTKQLNSDPPHSVRSTTMEHLLHMWQQMGVKQPKVDGYKIMQFTIRSLCIDARRSLVKSAGKPPPDSREEQPWQLAG